MRLIGSARITIQPANEPDKWDVKSLADAKKCFDP
jgi:hypothetical protein